MIERRFKGGEKVNFLTPEVGGFDAIGRGV
jgi:hypothetical protein